MIICDMTVYSYDQHVFQAKVVKLVGVVFIDNILMIKVHYKHCL